MIKHGIRHQGNYLVSSMSGAGVEYHVHIALTPAEFNTCSCPAMRFRKPDEYECKHILKVVGVIEVGEVEFP